MRDANTNVRRRGCQPGNVYGVAMMVCYVQYDSASHMIATPAGNKTVTRTITYDGDVITLLTITYIVAKKKT